MDYIPFEISWLLVGVALVGVFAALALLFLGLSKILPRALGVIFAIIGVIGFAASAIFGGLQFLPLAHQAQVAEKLTEHYGIDFDLFQVIELGYPNERPDSSGALAYGRVTIGDRELTLIWDGKQMQLGEPSDGRDPFIFLEPKS